MTKRKLIVALLLFLVYELIVWFGAAMLVEGSNFFLVVFLLTALGLTVVIVYLLISRMMARQAAPPAPAAPPAAAQPVAAAAAREAAAPPEFTAHLRALIAEADQRLAQSPTLVNKGLKARITDLPLYLIIGPPGCGKTSTVLGAGLSPELLAGQVYRDSLVLPTSFCNLWFAGNVVMAEAGGRLLNEDASQWRALLDCLRGGRSSAVSRLWKAGASNLRGVVLVCEVGSFFGVPDPNRIGGMARRFQERLRMIGEVFGANFPVYVVFSKADQMPFFGDYFGRLTDAEDQQVLGCTLTAAVARPAGEVYAETESAKLMAAFNRFYQSLAEKRLSTLAREYTPERKPGAYEFPRELKRVRDALVQFLVEAFRPNPLQPSPILRGFYFTGVRQVAAAGGFQAGTATMIGSRPGAGEATILFTSQATPPAGAAPAEAAREQPPNLVPRWSFVSDLFHRVVLADRLGVAARVTDRRQDTRRRIAFGVIAATATILSFCWLRSSWGNANLLDDAEEAAQVSFTAHAPGTLPSLNNLRSLDALRQQLELLNRYDEEGPPWRLRWGLYSGERIRSRLSEVYFQRFRHIFFQDTNTALVSLFSGLPLQAGESGGAPYNSVYDSIKAYRMMTSGQCKADSGFLAPVFLQTWQAGKAALDPERQVLAQQQVGFYTAQLARQNPYTVAEQARLIDHARSYLASFGGVDRLLRAIIEEANKEPRKPARLADIAPTYKDVLSGPGEVQAAFTKEGWEFVQKAIRDPSRLALGEPCVVGGAGTVQQLAQGPLVASELTSLYIREYIERWKLFASSTAVSPFGGVAAAARKLETLADNRSPLLAAVFLMAYHTNFAAPAPGSPPGSAAGAAGGLLERILPQSVKKAAEVAKQATPAAAPSLTPADIGRVFQPSREVVPAANRDRLIDDPNRAYMNALSELQRAMKRLETDRPNNPDMSLHDQARRSQEQGFESVRQIAQKFSISGAEGVDLEVKRLLEQPFRHVNGLFIADAAANAQKRAGGAVRALCEKLRPLQRKFPFSPQSDIDVTAEELAVIFAPPAGALFQLQQQLGKSVVRQGKFWMASPEADPRPSGELLTFLNRMTAVSETLFAEGPQMRMRYGLRPLSSPNIQATTMEIDGDTLASSGGQAAAKQFSWPGAGAQRIRVRVTAGATIPFASYDGPWGIFRLMTDADPRPAGSRIVQVSKVRQGRGNPEEVMDQSGKPIVLRLEITELPGGTDVFDRNFFHLPCPARMTE
jgi:type VI secretion system protein ImpL